MAAREIHDFIKTTRKVVQSGPELVTVVERDDIDSFLDASSKGDREHHLEWLRERGTLIAEADRFTHRVRLPDGKRRCYVFRGAAAKVPRIGRGRIGRVLTW